MLPVPGPQARFLQESCDYRPFQKCRSTFKTGRRGAAPGEQESAMVEERGRRRVNTESANDVGCYWPKPCTLMRRKKKATT
mmetsp:Transcript_3859/g.4475  ORF Transcript_3859/g.4475 Transcript_3859/m.4475 type:complete len:81 (-) Transcript_3859:44-286(-)